jgi:hypothetical protein
MARVCGCVLVCAGWGGDCRVENFVMRIWITQNKLNPKFVKIHTTKRDADKGIQFIEACRKHMAKLIAPTGKKLPEHGSAEVVTVRVEAK